MELHFSEEFYYIAQPVLRTTPFCKEKMPEISIKKQLV